MRANYHTHTWRCQHAGGTEREYVEAAIESGMEVLGFADHSPYPLQEGYVSRIRMRIDQLEDYVHTLEELREEYRDDIELHIGLEAEYFPARFSQLLELIADYPIEYLILGQHSLDEECPGSVYCGAPTTDGSLLVRYVDQVLEGLDTGRFLYLAHPDLFHYTGDAEFYDKEMLRLIHGAMERDIPLELNFLGLEQKRNYPNGRFWELVGQEKARVIYGCDAHQKECVFKPEVYAEAEDWAKRYQLDVIREPLKLS